MKESQLEIGDLTPHSQSGMARLGSRIFDAIHFASALKQLLARETFQSEPGELNNTDHRWIF